MAAIYSNGGNRWNILGFNFTKRDELSSVYKISMIRVKQSVLRVYQSEKVMLILLECGKAFQTNVIPYPHYNAITDELWTKSPEIAKFH